MSNYRREYFKGKESQKVHMCKYCGKMMMDRKKITIDHVLPQNLYRKMQRNLIVPVVPGLALAYYVNSVAPYVIGYIALIAVLLASANKFLHSKANLVVACQPCNSSKSDKIDHRVLIGFTAVIVSSTPAKIAIALAILYFILLPRVMSIF